MKTLPEIPEDQKTPVVQLLLRIIQEQSEEIDRLKEEISKLKGQKSRSKIPPSNVSSDAKHKIDAPIEREIILGTREGKSGKSKEQ